MKICPPSLFFSSDKRKIWLPFLDSWSNLDQCALPNVFPVINEKAAHPLLGPSLLLEELQIVYNTLLFEIGLES